MFQRFPRLKERNKSARRYPFGGEQQCCDRSRPDGGPKVLLFDEPSMGLSPILVEQIFDTIREINDQGTESYLWNRMRRWHLPSPTAAMYSIPATLCWSPPTTCCITRL